MSQPSPNPFADQPPQPINPYAAPAFSQWNVQPSFDGGVWRKGNILIMHQRAQLPPICVKSGLQATTWLKRDLTWFHPLCYLGLLGGLIPFLVLALVTSKKATVDVGLTAECYARRISRLRLAWILAAVGAACFVVGIVGAANDAPIAAIAFLPGLILLLVALVVGSVANSVVTAKKITDEYVWLKGVHPDLLNMLPEWTQP